MRKQVANLSGDVRASCGFESHIFRMNGLNDENHTVFFKSSDFMVFCKTPIGKLEENSALLAQVEEHFLGTKEVMGANPIEGFSG